MKRFLYRAEPLLTDMLENGEGTRTELFKRSGIKDWEEFQKIFSFLRSQNMLMGIIRKESGKIEIDKIPFVLSRHGKRFVNDFYYLDVTE